MITSYRSQSNIHQGWYKKTILAAIAVVVVLLLMRLLAPNLFTYYADAAYIKFSFVRTATTLFSDKQQLLLENAQLTNQLQNINSAYKLAHFNQQAYHNLWKETVGTDNQDIVRSVLLKPPLSPYDSYIVHIPESSVAINSLVTVHGQYVIGYVDLVAEEYARVRLFSSAGNDFTVSVDGRLFVATGLGGGSIQVQLSRDFAKTTGQLVHLPGAEYLTLGMIDVTQFDPQDSFVTGIVTLPHNIFNQEFVTITQQTYQVVDEIIFDEETQ